MTPAEIAARRLHRQGIARTTFDRPEDVVAWFGAVQAQDYLGALWAIGQRMRRATEALVEDAEARRAIVRTWPMRGTLHFVAADDARWLLRLLVPRIIARNQARWTREIGVTASMVEHAWELAQRALEGGRRMERNTLYAVFEAGRIRTGNSRGLHLLMWLSMQGRLCLAGRNGKQQTFALLDEWLPPSRPLEGEAALAELAHRYFASHGQATLKDFTWWSGLTVREARLAIDAAGRRLSAVTAGDSCWWSGGQASTPRRQARPSVRLLPAYDEYTVGYQDRSALMPAGKRLPSMALLAPAVIVDGQVTGTWKRHLARGAPRITIRMFRKLRPAESHALEEQMERYREFVGGTVA